MLHSESPEDVESPNGEVEAAQKRLQFGFKDVSLRDWLARSRCEQETLAAVTHEVAQENRQLRTEIHFSLSPLCLHVPLQETALRFLLNQESPEVRGDVTYVQTEGFSDAQRAASSQECKEDPVLPFGLTQDGLITPRTQKIM